MEEKISLQKKVKVTSVETQTEKFPEKQTELQFMSLYNSKSYSRTQFESIKFDYTWEIDRFWDFIDIIAEQISPPFPKTALYNIEMKVDHTSKKNIIRFYLRTKIKFLGLCSIFTIQPVQYLQIFHTEICVMSNGTLLCEISKESFLKCFYEKTLMLTFKFEIFHNLRTNITCAHGLSSSALLEDQMSGNSILDSILQNKSDDITFFKFILNEVPHIIPKALLRATNSTYFTNLCNTQNELNVNEAIPSEEFDVFMDMILFIANGSKPNYSPDDITYCMRMLKISDAYNVRDLKLICEQFIADHISFEHIMDIAREALICNAKFLLEHAISFIKLHIRKIVVTNNFQESPQDLIESILKLIEIINTSEINTVESI